MSLHIHCAHNFVPVAQPPVNGLKGRCACSDAAAAAAEEEHVPNERQVANRTGHCSLRTVLMLQRAPFIKICGANIDRLESHDSPRVCLFLSSSSRSSWHGSSAAARHWSEPGCPQPSQSSTAVQSSHRSGPTTPIQPEDITQPIAHHPPPSQPEGTCLVRLPSNLHSLSAAWSTRDLSSSLASHCWSWSLLPEATTRLPPRPPVRQSRRTSPQCSRQVSSFGADLRARHLGAAAVTWRWNVTSVE